jgi:hypothetical protein
MTSGSMLFLGVDEDRAIQNHNRSGVFAILRFKQKDLWVFRNFALHRLLCFILCFPVAASLRNRRL